MSYTIDVPIQLSREQRKERRCPSCGEKTFVPYIYVDSKQPVDETACGRCNREANCNYHVTPKQWKEDGGTLAIESHVSPVIVEKPTLYLPKSVCLKSIKTDLYAQNDYVFWLRNYYNTDLVYALAAKYMVGTGKGGATIYYQIDKDGGFRAGKIMKYDQNGKRRKEAGAIDWVHKRLEADGAINTETHDLRQILFGTHLILRNKDWKINIVESESTALFMACRTHGELWLATGGSNSGGGFKPENSALLNGRNVTLHPDKGYYNKWVELAFNCELHKKCELSVSDFMERQNDFAKNDDLRDYYRQIDNGVR